MVVGAHHKADTNPGHQFAPLTFLERYHFAVKDIHPAVIPQTAECRAVAKRMNIARIADLRAVCKTLRDAERLHVADDRRSIYKVVPDRRVR